MGEFRRSARRWTFAAATLVAAWAIPCPAQVVRQLTDEKTTVAGPGAMDDAGTVIFAGASCDPAGTNPDHAFEIFRFDPVSGASTQITTAPRGVSPLASVSDDGSWIAFPSPADLTGQNHDQSIELFVMASNGTQITQLTNDPAPNAGSVTLVAMAGGATKIAFLANTDPLGTNAQHATQLFVINRDGTGLRQLTQLASGAIGSVSISDDGTRVAFTSDADLVAGGNPDLGAEIFVMGTDGTGLRQLTHTAATYVTGSPSLSGNGQEIAFQSNDDLTGTGTNSVHQDEIFAIAWSGTGLKQLTRTGRVLGLLGAPASQSPSITDDGLTVFYHSNNSRLFPPLNLDGNYEIFKIKTDGTGLTPLTNTLLSLGNFFPTVSGNGTRVTFYAIDTNVTLAAMDGTGAGRKDLVVFNLIFNQEPAITPDGGTAVYVRATGLLSTGQIWRAATDGSGLSQVTSLSSGSPASPSIAADDDTIVFSATSDPVGGNADGSEEIFAIQADGTGIRQLTSGASGTACQDPVIAAGGTAVVFDCDADLTGGNADASREVFKVNPDGTGLVQLTSGPASTISRFPRPDAAGTWVVFESNADLDGGNPDGTYEVFRVWTDGTGLERITGSPTADSRQPDITAAGDRIVFSSDGNPLGTNPELNGEVFVYDTGTATLTQLTSSVLGSSGGARFGADGTWVTFSSSAPIFESDPDQPTDLYRIPAAGGPIERIGALRAGALGGFSLLGLVAGGGGGVAPDASGQQAVFSGIGDFTEGNRDLLPEVWAIDRTAAPQFAVSKESPTVLSWSVESGPLRYDAIRGSLASLRLAGDGTVDLGAVQCLEDDSPDATTVGFGDPLDPVPGQGFFFLYRGSQGLLDGPGTYGTSSDGRERKPTAGDCPAQ